MFSQLTISTSELDAGCQLLTVYYGGPWMCKLGTGNGNTQTCKDDDCAICITIRDAFDKVESGEGFYNGMFVALGF